MNLIEAIGMTGLSQRQFATVARVPKSTLHRLLTTNQWPRNAAATKKQLAEALTRSTEIVDPLREIAWPGEAESPASLHLETPMKLDHRVLQHFGLQRNPFDNDVEEESDVLRFRGYETAEKAIADAIEERGFVAVVAESGAGKTTVMEGVEGLYLNREDTIICKPAVKDRERLTPDHMARALIYSLLGENTTIRANAEDRGRQLSVALRQLRAGAVDKNCVLYIDDAHFCTTRVLRQLKTFYEEKVGRFRLMSIVLVGLPELKEKLSLFGEIGNRIRLVELPPVVVDAYLEFKLKRVGSSMARLFDAGGREAFLARFHQPKRGALARPLIINAACIRAMNRLYDNGAQVGEKISREIIDQLPGAVTMRRPA
jgi:type II secretory pathway predicted ATPase ExeA